MKRKLIILTSMLTLFSSTISYGATFADISNIPWSGAESYINSVSTLGLMVGETDDNGKSFFRAKDSITYCETMQLAYNLMKKTSSSSEVKTNKWTTVMSGYNIPEWAYDAVAYGLENNIISANDVSRFVTGTANNYATREDVSVIFGKMLALSQSVDANATLNFADKAQVDNSSVPYINLLVNQQIIVGDDDNNFRPKDTINRAEMAVIVSKTYSASNGTASSETQQQEISGSVISMEPFGSSYILTVNTSSGQNGYLGSTSLPVTYGTQTLQLSDIVVGDTVSLQCQDSEIQSIVLTAHSSTTSTSTSTTSTSTSDDKLEGEIKSLSTSKIKIQNDDDTYSYTIEDEDITVKLDGSSSDLDELIDAYDDGDTITVTLTLNDDNEVTKIVATTEDEDDDDITGEISSITTSKVKISGYSTYYKIEDEDDVDVDVDDGTESSSITNLDDLIEAVDDNKVIEATITIEDGYVVKIKGEVTEVSGEVYSLDADDCMIKITTDSGNYKYEIDDDADIELDDDDIDLDDLEDALSDDAIDVEMSLEDGYVVEIIATTN